MACIVPMPAHSLNWCFQILWHFDRERPERWETTGFLQFLFGDACTSLFGSKLCVALPPIFESHRLTRCPPPENCAVPKTGFPGGNV